MIDTDEKVDARTVEEDMETRNNMTWLNNRVVELEAEVKRLRKLDENARRLQEKIDWLRSALDGILHDLKEIIE
jgi:predicted transcriptional regulator